MLRPDADTLFSDERLILGSTDGTVLVYVAVRLPAARLLELCNCLWHTGTQHASQRQTEDVNLA